MIKDQIGGSGSLTPVAHCIGKSSSESVSADDKGLGGKQRQKNAGVPSPNVGTVDTSADNHPPTIQHKPVQTPPSKEVLFTYTEVRSDGSSCSFTVGKPFVRVVLAPFVLVFMMFAVMHGWTPAAVVGLVGQILRLIK